MKRYGLYPMKIIFYYTLKAVVEGSGMENNNYAIVEIDEGMTMNIIGFRKTDSIIVSFFKSFCLNLQKISHPGFNEYINITNTKDNGNYSRNS